MYQIRKAINSFAPGSSGGLDGLRPQLLKDMIAKSNGEVATSLLRDLDSLFAQFLKGQINDEVRPYFFGARLVPLIKPNKDIRPIAVGNTLRRLVCKLCASILSKEMSEEFAPRQMGVGVVKGAEAAVHASRVYSGEKSTTERKVLVKIDYTNAFNCIRRDVVLQEVHQKINWLYPFCCLEYGSSSALQLSNGSTIESAEGVQQGDPLGPGLFSLGINRIVQNVSTEFSVWYLDDGTIGGSLESVSSNLKMIVTESQKLGLSVNPRKCEILPLVEDKGIANEIVREISSIIPGVIVLAENEAVLLGSPIREESIDIAIERKKEDLKKSCQALKKVDRHSALYLLKNCLSNPKIIYLLRTTPCFNHSGLAEMDVILKNALQEILNCGINDEQWDLASLPIRDGGLGLRKTEDLAIPAYLSSVWSTKRLVSAILGGKLPADQSDPEHTAGAMWASQGLEVPADTEKGFQKAWDTIQVKEVVNYLVERHKDDSEWMSRFQSCRGAYSGAWLNTLPMEGLGLKLNDEEARIAAALRIGTRVYKEHICVCGERADERGVHGLSCPMGGFRIARHQSINQVVKRAFGSAQIPAVLEPQGICRKDGKRPDGLSMIPWKMGKSLIWDFSCVNPLTKSYTKAAAKSPLAAAKQREVEKNRKYTELVDEYLFVPLVVEVFGSWGPSGLRMLKDLGKKIREVRNDDRASLYLMQSLSINLQKGNAACIRGTLKDLDDQCETEEIRY